MEKTNDKQKGLYNRYTVLKSDGSNVDPKAEYFVLRLDDHGKDPVHIKACRQAVLTYATIIRNHLPELSDDIFSKYGNRLK